MARSPFLCFLSPSSVLRAADVMGATRRGGGKTQNLAGSTWGYLRRRRVWTRAEGGRDDEDRFLSRICLENDKLKDLFA
jgi:hypothetical protein